MIKLILKLFLRLIFLVVAPIPAKISFFPDGSGPVKLVFTSIPVLIGA